MSHEATNWAIKQRGLKPTTKIVLWHLCDRFNPDYGCFPSQDRLAHDCEISRSTLNDHLGQLEAVGLLRRVPRLDPVTKRQLPTRYILGFEPWLHTCSCGAVSGNRTRGGSRRGNLRHGGGFARRRWVGSAAVSGFRTRGGCRSRVRFSGRAVSGKCRKPCPDFGH
ncbi:helix-turn-helix domain-containing protein [Paracoccus sp. DMF-8]|uniref:helix-turn-helix domain-containing protein n=1 Tax=Paracoccus sp. DMF-8 TaxID=3019445 RepID=UPI003204DFD6